MILWLDILVLLIVPLLFPYERLLNRHFIHVPSLQGDIQFHVTNFNNYLITPKRIYATINQLKAICSFHINTDI